MWLAPRSGRFTSDKDLVHNVQEAGWALKPVWTTENFVPLAFDPRSF
jgi:hypothetical protein